MDASPMAALVTHLTARGPTTRHRRGDTHLPSIPHNTSGLTARPMNESPTSRIAELKAVQDSVYISRLHDQGALVSTVHAMINQRRRQRFDVTMKLIQLQLRAPLSPPRSLTEEAGTVSDVLNRYVRGRGGQRIVVRAASSDDGDKGENTAAQTHEESPSSPEQGRLIRAQMVTGAQVKTLLMKDVTATDHEAAVQRGCAVSLRPPARIQQLLVDRCVLPRIEEAVPLRRREDEPLAEEVSWNGTAAAAASSAAAAISVAPVFVPRPPPSRGAPAPTLSRQSSRKSSQVFELTETDDRGVPLDEAAVRARRIAAVRKTPADFDQLRNQDKHAQVYRLTNLQRSRVGRPPDGDSASRASRLQSNVTSSVGSDDQTGSRPAAALVAPPAAAAATTSRRMRLARPLQPTALTARHAQYRSTDVATFLEAVKHGTNTFHTDAVKELTRVRHAQSVFHDVKRQIADRTLAAADLCAAPADKVLRIVRARVQHAAQRKDQAERLDVFYEQIAAIQGVLALLFQTADHVREANVYLDKVRDRVKLRDGRQNTKDFESVSLDAFPPERLLQTAVVDLLSLVAPMFSIAAEAFAAWVNDVLHRYDEREREYMGVFRNIERRMDRESATEARMKLTVHTIRGFATVTTGRPQMQIRVVCDKKILHTAAIAAQKPQWHEMLHLHLQNDVLPVLFYVLCEGEVIGHGTLNVSHMPIGHPQKMWLPTPGATSTNGQLQITMELMPPTMFVPLQKSPSSR